ncbi:uncharacterized protein LOC131944376 [Physella acuta]|uniref:uncharacterized protein LOC131944376 n=1 Tax=Physella acuta TaxID=109671 RepID=UPI0027DACEBD|nr:uncharacterized protein LOC131944376 [Physella acuta]
MLSALLVIAVCMTATAVSALNKPCLSDQLEYGGYDSFGRYSYNALDFKKKMSGLQRIAGSKMVKDFSGAQARRYDITPDNCTVTNISSSPDTPQCVPDDAMKVPANEGFAWKFQNVDGATLFYNVTSDPSMATVVLEKDSPKQQANVIYFNWSTVITDADIFVIPARCHGN